MEKVERTRYLNDQYIISGLQLKMIQLFPEDCDEILADVYTQLYKAGGVPDCNVEP
jgi:hypothetical protein